MRSYVDKIPSANNIMPPQNEFTNVPRDISFSNRIYSYEAEYELSVSLAGSRICLRNGNDDSQDTLYIDFTERFLDNIISMVKWERYENLLREKDRSKDRDDSIYQDFKTVLVDINWNEYDLDLICALADNPFMEVLWLVWEEYEDILREKNLVLPWFDILGWS